MVSFAILIYYHYICYMSLKIEEAKCPCCDHKLDAVSGVNTDKQPEAGDISVCFYCGSINQFDADGQLYEMPDEVMEEIKEEDPETHRMLIDTVIMIKARTV